MQLCSKDVTNTKYEEKKEGTKAKTVSYLLNTYKDRKRSKNN